MAFLLANGKPLRQKIAITVAAACVIAFISFSRLYPGVHWFSDVVGSLSLGLLWVALLSIAYTHHVKGQQLAVLPVSLVMFATLILVGIFYLGDRHAYDMERYAYQPPAKAMLLPDWTGIGWRRLPSARAELEGELEEPFSIQWAATDAALGTTLAAAGWQTPPSWASKAMLLWLLPKTPIEQLPVLPKFDHGQTQKITFVKVLGPNERAVMRLWPSPYTAQPNAEAPPRPLWKGLLTLERLRPLAGLGKLAATEPDFNKPVRELQHALQKSKVMVEKRERGNASVLLVWQ